MTTIIAVQSADGVSIGADTQATDASGRMWATIKIVANGKFLISGAGDCFPLDVLGYIWKPPTLTQDDRKDLFKFMASKVAPSIQSVLKTADYTPDKSDGNAGFDAMFVICGELFVIGEDFAVVRPRFNVAGAGSGSAYAIGAIRAGATIEEALQYAADSDSDTSAPFIFHKQSK